MKIYYAVLFFTLYSFAGWLIELAYRSFTQKRFVNPGFLFGPFVPLYGIGAIAVFILYDYILKINIALQFFLYFVLLSAIEYITGEIFERAYGLKLWDYSNNRFNIKGKISPAFSVVWAVMAILTVNFIHPFIERYVYMIDPAKAQIASAVFGLYFATDFCFSVVSLSRFSRNFRYIYSKYNFLTSAEASKILLSFKRILGAFPNLGKILSDKFNINLKDRLNSAMGKITDIADSVISVLNERKPREEEYYNIVNDILANQEFLRLRDFYHHNSSIYDHAKMVSYVAYRICKFLKLDYVSAARGGLLHDFFLYNWRHHDEPDLHRDKYHGLEHPKIALANAEKHFKVNEIEKDIIIKHMWPLTISPPHYYESFIVSFVDKYISSVEFIDEYRKKMPGVELLKKHRKTGHNRDEM
ncbi:MAG: hypothetical protein JXN64_08025 [Spirochaetes bacterium]|nr:hypothetical protein [Spirochaetota bacterium]